MIASRYTPVRHVESGIEFPSISAAARHFKISRKYLQRTLGNEQPFNPGLTFERLPTDIDRLRIIINPSEPEEFKPIKGFETLYEISNKGQIRSLKFPDRIKKPSTNKSGQHIIVLNKDHTPHCYTVESIYQQTWQNKESRSSIFKKQRNKQVMCTDDNRIFNSYMECCQFYGIDYQKFRTALHSSSNAFFTFTNKTLTLYFKKIV